MEGMIGEIRMFAGNFAPKNWAFCQAQIINIASNTALFSILGTTYGGNGTTTFALPDLQGRVAIGQGTGPGLSGYALGQKGGAISMTLGANNMPLHTHFVGGSFTVNASAPVWNDEGSVPEPANNYPAGNSAYVQYATSDNTYMGNIPATVTGSNLGSGMTGGNMPFSIQEPILGMNYVICMYGIFPSRG